jgi:hypothetical protein
MVAMRVMEASVNQIVNMVAVWHGLMATFANDWDWRWVNGDKTVAVTNRTARLVFEVNSAPAQINGIKVRLSFPFRFHLPSRKRFRSLPNLISIRPFIHWCFRRGSQKPDRLKRFALIPVMVARIPAIALAGTTRRITHCHSPLICAIF